MNESKLHDFDQPVGAMQAHIWPRIVKAELLRQDIADLQDKPIEDIQLPEKVENTP